ncbi:hypothetical protein Tco_1336822 [Tanacetum coccineum]
MSNTNNNNMQTQTLSALQNAIMKADGKDHPPMLAPGNYVQWKSRIKRYIDTKPNHELIHFCLKNPPYQYKFLTTDANVTPVTLGNEVDACPNAIEMWKAIERLKQGKSINVQDLETNLYWEVYFTGRSQAATRNRGKAIANSPPPTFDSKPEVDTDDDTSLKEKEIDKLIALT